MLPNLGIVDFQDERQWHPLNNKINIWQKNSSAHTRMPRFVWAMNHRSTTNIRILTVNDLWKECPISLSVVTDAQIHVDLPCLLDHTSSANPLMTHRHQSIGAQSTDPLFVQRYQPIMQIGKLHVTHKHLSNSYFICEIKSTVTNE